MNTTITEDEVLQAECIERPQPILTGEDVALISVGSAGVFLVVIVGGAVAGNAVLLSLLTVGGGSILWIKAPRTIGEIPLTDRIIKIIPLSGELKTKILAYDWKSGLLRHEMLLDLGVSLGVVALLGTTLTGLVAAGLTGLSVSVLLRLSKVMKRLGNNLDVLKTKLAV